MLDIHFQPFRFGKIEITFIMALMALFVLWIAVATVPFIATWYAYLTIAWTKLALHYGYWGAFFSALFGSLTIVIVFPYTIVILFLATQGLNPIYLGMLMGLGATIGDMTGYFIGRMGSNMLQKQKPETFQAISKLITERPRIILRLLFLFSVTPLPDDVLFIPLGILRYPWWKVVLSTLPGKILSGLVVTLFGFYFRHAIDTTVAGASTAVVSQFGTIVAVALMIYLFLKLDWQKVLHRFIKENTLLPNNIT